MFQNKKSDKYDRLVQWGKKDLWAECWKAQAIPLLTFFIIVIKPRRVLMLGYFLCNCDISFFLGGVWTVTLNKLEIWDCHGRERKTNSLPHFLNMYLEDCGISITTGKHNWSNRVAWQQLSIKRNLCGLILRMWPSILGFIKSVNSSAGMTGIIHFSQKVV